MILEAIKRKLKGIMKAGRLPLIRNRPDVRLLNNRIWPHPSEVGRLAKEDKKY